MTKRLIDVDAGALDGARAQLGFASRRCVRGSKHSVPNVLIAAVGEGTARSVLHYDAEFDRIASFTGQAAESVVPQGSVD